MALDTFDFPYHLVETQNPESGTRIQLGGSYVFSSPPESPPQRTFVLSFPMMKFFLNPGTGLLDATIEPKYNMLALIQFYQAHLLHESFLYQHPVHGVVEVKFGKPLIEPKGKPGGIGATEAFEVEFIEIP